MIRYRFWLDFGVGSFHPKTVSVVGSKLVLTQTIA